MCHSSKLSLENFGIWRFGGLGAWCSSGVRVMLGHVTGEKACAVNELCLLASTDMGHGSLPNGGVSSGDELIRAFSDRLLSGSACLYSAVRPA